jgi:citrate synthase
MKSIIDGFPRTAHPMGVLAALTSALTAFNPKSVEMKKMYHRLQDDGEILVIATWTYREKHGLSFKLL